MSTRRAARGRAPAPRSTNVPVEFRDQLHPIWRDLDALQAHPVLSEYIDQAVVSRLRMRGRVYHHVLDAWAQANGYTGTNGLTDLHALRAAGIIR